MAAFKAKAQAKVLTERIKVLSSSAVTVTETEDANKWPILEIIRGSERVYVKVDDTGVGLRVDAITGAAQRFYSPHKVTVIKDIADRHIAVYTITDWEATETVSPMGNTTLGAPVAFNVDNNTSVIDLAAEMALFPGVISAVPSGSTITVTSYAVNPIIFTFTAGGGGDGVTFATSITAAPDLELRALVMIEAAEAGMLTLIYAKSNPTSFDLTGAYLEARIKADPYNQGVSGSFQ